MKLVVGPFWDEKIETASVEELRSLQTRLFRRQIKRVYEKSRFYRRKFKAHGVNPSQIRSLDDVTKLPFTTRAELEENFEGILSIPTTSLATIRQTSGTTGSPLTIAHSKKDLNIIANAYARKLFYHGITNQDIVQVTATYGLWQGAWSIHYGAEKLGCFVLPVSSGNTERQVKLIKRFAPTVLYAVTSYHFRIAEVAKQMGEDLRSSSLKMGICVTERPTMQQTSRLKKEFGYDKVMIDYGATEFPGFSVQCRTNPNFHHIYADYHFVESVDPKSLEPVQKGERGELVVTTLQREAFPLIRYLSSDVTELTGCSSCDCGLNHPKVSVDIDRKDFMVKVKGTAIFPSSLEHILEDFDEVTGRSQIIVDKSTPRQEAILNVEAKTGLPKTVQQLLKMRIRNTIKSRIGVTLDEIVFVPAGTFEDKFQKSVVIK
jgi:phenylacetate-CoA ligase